MDQPLNTKYIRNSCCTEDGIDENDPSIKMALKYNSCRDNKELMKMFKEVYEKMTHKQNHNIITAGQEWNSSANTLNHSSQHINGN